MKQKKIFFVKEIFALTFVIFTTILCKKKRVRDVLRNNNKRNLK